MKSLRVLGVMSGTSLGGVDYALCRVGPKRIELLSHWDATYPRALEERLRAAARGEARSWELAQLHHDLGRFYARHATRFPRALRPQLAALHGQTIFHHPDPRRPATFQLGEAAYVAEQLCVPVVNNFRVADLAAGGQGAPLATSFHVRVFARRGQHVCVNNLGGISNVTSIDWRSGARPKIIAFDTGPANLLLDLATRELTRGSRTMDRDGAWAARGQPCEALINSWLAHPYFRLPPPKSTGRELFGEAFWQEIRPQLRRRRLTSFDTLATLTQFTAQSIALNYARHLPAPPDVMILAGGGAANEALSTAIGEALTRQVAPGIRIRSCDELGWPRQTVEPAAFALLGWLRIHHLPGNAPETTGARHAAVLGQISQASAADRFNRKQSKTGRRSAV